MKYTNHLTMASKLKLFFYIYQRCLTKRWNEGLISKLQQNDISGNLVNLFCDFVRNKKQRTSSQIGLMLKQVSRCSPGLNTSYINQLTGLSSNAKLFANNTYLFSVIHDSNISALELHNNLAKIGK